MIRGKPSRPSHIAALDIGTTKIACFIATLDANANIKVTGIGHQLAKGIRSGVITDVSEAETSIVAAVHAAEEMAGETIDDAMVNLIVTGPSSRHVTVELEVAGQGVTDQDMADIIREGRASVEHDDYEIIHCFPISYQLDNTRNIKDPRQMIGNKLSADLHIITAPGTLIRNLENCVARCHLNVQDYAISSHASALACLEPDEMELGVTVIDMGGGATSFAVFSGGKNIYSDAVPIGGMHVTSDIAKGLSTTLAHAERLKTLHGSAIASNQDEQVMIDVPQLGEIDDGEEGNLMPRSMLVGVIRPRLEEIFEIIRSKIEISGVDKLAGRRVVLTGGASQMLGVRELASRMLSKQIRLGKPFPKTGLADAVSGPAFSTAMGMLECMARRSAEEAMFNPKRSSTGLFGKFEGVTGWFKKNF